MTRIAAVRWALPLHRYVQSDITTAFADVTGSEGLDRALLERMHRNAGVAQRHLALPLEEYVALPDFGAANDAFIAAGVDLGAQALDAAVKAADLTPEDVDLVISTTITGLAVPSLDARLAGQVGLRQDVKRVPIVGLGCVAGAAGLARLHDYLVGHPDQVAALLSVELCSLTLQRQDTSVANLVASGLFGDGAAAVVAVGDTHPRAVASASTIAGEPSGPEDAGPEILASRSRLYPDSERAMGWDVGSGGLRIVLGAEVPELVRAHVRGDVDAFLYSNGLERSDIAWWVCHPGGPKVLRALEAALDVGADALAVTWASLRDVGNLSSGSVLHVLGKTLSERPPVRGTYGLAMAMGPGFCLELVLLRA